MAQDAEAEAGEGMGIGLPASLKNSPGRKFVDNTVAAATGSRRAPPQTGVGMKVATNAGQSNYGGYFSDSMDGLFWLKILYL
jgi:hypothetical protein